MLGDDFTALEHRFFHYDTSRALHPGQVLHLDESGLSRFGPYYVDLQRQTGEARRQPALRREMVLEALRIAEFPQRPSRYVSLFGAMSAADAMQHLARRRKGTPDLPAVDHPLYEVYTQTFHAADVMWLDIAGLRDEQMLVRYRKYWAGETTDDRKLGLVRDPLLEVMLSLPVRVGEPHEPHDVRGQRHQARLKEPWALALRREQLQGLTLVPVGRDVGEVKVSSRSHAPTGPTTHPIQVKGLAL